MDAREIYQRTDGKWAWRLKADNGEIIATDGGQGYENRADAEAIAKRISFQPTCPSCDGEGMVSNQLHENGEVTEQWWSECTTCRGTGIAP